MTRSRTVASGRRLSVEVSTPTTFLVYSVLSFSRLLSYLFDTLR
jgi:hypothetical protein